MGLVGVSPILTAVTFHSRIDSGESMHYLEAVVEEGGPLAEADFFPKSRG